MKYDQIFREGDAKYTLYILQYIQPDISQPLLLYFIAIAGFSYENSAEMALVCGLSSLSVQTSGRSVERLLTVGGNT